MVLATFSAVLISFAHVIYGSDDMMLNNSSVVLLTSSQYCYVNESIIRINDSDVNIIDSTGGWIMTSNNVYIFIAPANGTNCTSNNSYDNYSNTMYIIQIFLLGFGILVSAAIIALHLFDQGSPDSVRCTNCIIVYFYNSEFFLNYGAYFTD